MRGSVRDALHKEEPRPVGMCLGQADDQVLRYPIPVDGAVAALPTRGAVQLRWKIDEMRLKSV